MGHGRPGQRTQLLLAVVALGCATNAFSQQDAPPAPLLSAEATTAELLDLSLVAPNDVWAVGQHGVVWHSDDAGQSWRLRHFERELRLAGVCFVDSEHGWAVGHRPRAWPAAARGVVLRTSDGGATWEEVPGLLLPALRWAKFFDERQGVAIGEISSLYTSGIAVTADGGRSWSPRGGPRAEGLVAADFAAPQQGAAAPARGIPLWVDGRATTPSRCPSLGLAAIRDLALRQDGGGWAVGDGSAIVRTSDGGRSWERIEAAQLPAAAAHFDWQAVATAGSLVWVAGNPGSAILHSADAGATWQIVATGQMPPINSLAMIDAERGFAVGALGAISKTSDGGATWQVAQRGSPRLAWLGLFGEPRSVPLEAVAKLSAAEGYLGGVRFLLRRDATAAPGDEAQTAGRAGDLFAAIGAAHASFDWRFPVRERELDLPLELAFKAWRASDGPKLLEERVVRQLRVWRPEVVITDAPSAGTQLEQLVSRAVVAAVESAANADAFAEHSSVGLAPWQVKKVYCLTNRTDGAAATVVRAEVAPRLGASLEEYVEIPRGYLESLPRPNAPVLSFDQLLADAASGRDFFAGIRLDPRDNLRHEQALPEGSSLASVRQSSERTRNLRAIIQLSGNGSLSSGQVLGQIERLTAGLEPRPAGAMLYQLGEHYFQLGRWSLAVDTWKSLVDRYADHPLAGSALMRLIELWTSGEAAHRFADLALLAPSGGATNQLASLQTAEFEGAVGGAGRQRQQPNVPALIEPPAEAAEGLADRRSELFRLANAMGARLEKTDPLAFGEPLVRFPLNTSARALGGGDRVSRYLNNLRDARAHDGWWAAAAAEMAIADDTTECPLPRRVCRRVAAKPHLDGRFDDDPWQTADGIELKSPYRDDAAWPTTVRLAHDGEFLYLAVDCHATDAARPQPRADRRTRDADLASDDRIELAIDIDRDYRTCYELAVNSRGATRDLCLGDPTWNPRWFVATANTPRGWSAECAIPLAELAANPPTAGETWAVSLRRIAPTLGYQSAAPKGPTTARPESFGLVSFE